MSIEAMKLALEALEQWTTPHWAGTGVEEANAAHAALRTAIEQAEKQEPVAWQVMVEDEAMKEFPIKDMAHDWCVKQKLSGSPYSYWIRPLYTIPPAAQRQPLTEEQIDDIWNRYCDEMGEASINDAYDIARAIEAAHGIGEKK
jgi:hypothetical protein